MAESLKEARERVAQELCEGRLLPERVTRADIAYAGKDLQKLALEAFAVQRDGELTYFARLEIDALLDGPAPEGE